jgi:hypothetical protein
MQDPEERALLQEAWDRHNNPKVLIAVVSCARDRHTHDNVRTTWGKDIPVDLKFFVGQDNGSLQEDEVALPVSDLWDDLPAKVQQVCKYAVEHNYDYLFKCDTDTYIHVPRLLASGFQNHDYTGSTGQENVYPDSCFPASGAGYWLSKKSFTYLADHMNLGLGKHCEDWCVFLSLMKGAGIFVKHDARYSAINKIPRGIGPAPDNDYIILHDQYEANLKNPECMRKAHARANSDK